MPLELPRRRFLQCLTGIIAAPAIVKADSLMRVFAAPEGPGLIYCNRAIRSALDIEAIRGHNVLLKASDWKMQWGDSIVVVGFPITGDGGLRTLEVYSAMDQAIASNG
jgi:hypothetical protein